ncbi:unnamed protein product [Clavelina lepadiformis]|uniref:Uncharacterized protein n=1 Tax=Clavelina lepadiformis TaxID=159417 RepID=A0ABP0FN25_CLALP
MSVLSTSNPFKNTPLISVGLEISSRMLDGAAGVKATKEGKIDPSLAATLARSLPRPSQRYHPLLSPIPNSENFVFTEDLGTSHF